MFDNATTYTCLLFLSNKHIEEFDYYEFEDISENIENDVLNNNISFYKISSDSITSENWIFTNKENNQYLDLMKKNNPTLDKITTNIFQGPKAGADNVFILLFIEEIDNKYKVYSNSLETEVLIEKNILKNIKLNEILNLSYIHTIMMEICCPSIIFKTISH